MFRTSTRSVGGFGGNLRSGCARRLSLSEANTGSAVFLKKLASSATSATAVQVGPDPGVWLSGAPHVVFFPGTPARLAGNVWGAKISVVPANR